MENFMRKLRKTSLYFWLVLVIPQSITQITDIAFIWDKILDTALNILSWFIISGIVGISLAKTDLFVSWGLPTTIAPYIFVVVVILIGRILQNLFTIPARLYFAARKMQDSDVWKLIYVTTKGIPNKKASLGYGVHLMNDTPFELPRVIIQIPYFDIDDVRYEQTEWFGFSQRPDSHIRRLTWLNSDSSSQATERGIEPDGGNALAYLFDIVRTNNGRKEFYLRYNERSETTGQFEEKSKKINNRASGLLIIHGIHSGRYYFEIFIDEDQEIKMELSDKSISTYKPPKTEVL